MRSQQWLAVPGGLLACVLSVACSKDPQAARAEHVKRGDDFFAKQQYQEAIIEYRGAIQSDPRSGDARVKLAEAYARVDDTTSAYKEYLRAADLMPDNEEVQLKAGGYELMVSQFEDAKTRAKKILAKRPGNSDAQLLLGAALAGLKDLEGAVKEIDEAIRLNPSQGPAYLNLGAIQLARGRHAEAEAALQKAVELDPKSMNARLALAQYYWAVGQRNQAEAAIKGAIELEATNPLANRAAAAFYLTSDHPGEAEHFLKVAADTSNVAGARITLADYYMLMHRTDDAVKVLESVSGDKDKDMDAAARIRLSAIQYDQKRPSDAYATLDAVLKKDPKNAQALILKAQFLLGENKLDEALAQATAAVAAARTNPDTHFTEGLVRAAKNDIQGAIAEMQETLKISPKAAGAQAQLARLYLVDGQPKTSLQFAQDAAASQPSNPEVRAILIRALMADGRLNEAENELKAVRPKDAGSADVQALSGMLSLLKSDPAAARLAFNRAAERDPNSLDALAGLVSLDIAAGNRPAAGARLDAALAKRPNDQRLLMLSGRTYAATGDASRAEGMFRQAIQVNPSDLDAYRHLGQLYLTQNRLDEARTEFETVLKRAPNSVSAETMVAVILEAQNRSDEARKHYQHALEVDSNAAVAANNLAWMMAERGENIDVALQLAQTATSQLPDQPEVNDTLGWIYMKKGMFGQAIPALQHSVDRDPKNPIYHYHLGLAYVRSGNEPKARAALEQALKLKPNFSGADEARKLLAGMKS